MKILFTLFFFLKSALFCGKEKYLIHNPHYITLFLIQWFSELTFCFLLMSFLVCFFFLIPKCHCDISGHSYTECKLHTPVFWAHLLYPRSPLLCASKWPCSMFNKAARTQQQAHTMQHGLLLPPLGIHLRDCMGECLINCCMNHLISSNQDHRADCITTEMAHQKQPNTKIHTHKHQTECVIGLSRIPHLHILSSALFSSTPIWHIEFWELDVRQQDDCVSFAPGWAFGLGSCCFLACQSIVSMLVSMQHKDLQ